MLDIFLPESVMFILGMLYRFFPPNHINDLHGYRTKLSKQNKETWKMGNRKSGLGFIVASLLSLTLGLLIYHFDVPYARLINLIVTIISAFLVVRWTEYKLKDIFEKE